MTIREALKLYKSNFSEFWEGEKYKWVAAKHYKDHWNINADDFAGMLKESFSQTENLLRGSMYYPYKMICHFSEQDPEKMRSLFRTLYDKSLPLAERIKAFRSGCDELLKKYRELSSANENAKNHYQDLRAISVYLAFEFPEKYFIYKYRMYAGFRDLIGFKETSEEKDSEARKLDNYTKMCQSVVDEINADSDLVQMQKKQIESEPECNSDPEFHLLAQTVIFVTNWMENDEKTKGIVTPDGDVKTTHYWIYSPGDGAEIWDECYENGFMAIGWDKIGDLSQYNSKAEMQNAMKEKIDPSTSHKNGAHATWQFAKEMKPGDIVYAKKGMHLIIGRGVVESEYEFDASRNHYKNIRKVKWTHKGEWTHPGQAAMKTLTDITSYTNYVEKLEALFEIDIIDIVEKAIVYPEYTAADFLEEVFMDDDSYNTLVSLVRNKKNVILQGAPGVGKTFAAKRLAYSMMGVKDPSRVMMVQFHQSYSYEDFIMGFRPSENGFELKRGAFYNFCKDAEIDSDNEYFFIIDEINRGNLSKIFGELFMLIESDKRGVELQLLYSDEKFSVPANVYIIGMMNTADRSLAMLDYALRRRFAFFEMKPGFDTDGFREYRMGLANEKFDRLINCVENLNSVIAADESLGEGFCIGHSYFCNLKKVTDQALSAIVEYELNPLLKEYWFDEPTKVKDWINNLRSAIK